MSLDCWDLQVPIPEDTAIKYFRDVVKGLEYLHFNRLARAHVSMTHQSPAQPSLPRGAPCTACKGPVHTR